MRKHRITLSVVVALIAVLGLALAISGPALAGDTETKEVKKVKKVQIKKKMIECENEDCDHADHHRMIIEKHGDMDQIVVECEGEECEEQMKIFISKDGEMQKAHAMAGHDVKWIEKECEGDDCEVQVRVFVKKGGELEEIHGEAAHHMMAHGEECEGEDCAKKMRVIIKGNEAMKKAHAMAGKQVVWDSDECEGEDCKQERRIIIRKGDGMHPGSEDHFIWAGRDGDKPHVEMFDAGKGGFLGILLTDLSEELRTHFGAPADQGVMIGKVQPESAAETAGLRVGDIVATVNGAPVGSSKGLSQAIRSHEGGESVDLGIWRDGQAETVTAVLGESKAKAPHRMHTMVAFCGEGEDCEMEFGQHAVEYDCGGAEECKVEVECESDECTCTANGESIDCAELNLPHHTSKE